MKSFNHNISVRNMHIINDDSFQILTHNHLHPKVFKADNYCLDIHIMIFNTSSVSPELLQRFARALARVAFLRNMALLSINMKAIWQASFLKSREQADQCNNSGETEEVVFFIAPKELFFPFPTLRCPWQFKCTKMPKLHT